MKPFMGIDGYNWWKFCSNGRSCNINTVLWNTIQLLFPKEVESRKEAAAASLNSRTTDDRRNTSERTSSLSNRSNNNSNRYMTRRLRPLRSEDAGLSSRRGVPDQDEDAALALRLQREEFMEIYRGSSLARDNLRAMARRAMNLARNYRAVWWSMSVKGIVFCLLISLEGIG